MLLGAAFGPPQTSINTDMSAPLLVVSAHGPEQSGLVATLGDELRGTLGGNSVIARPVGIGLSAAAVGTASALVAIEPRAVVFVGTCGAYAGRGPTLGDVVVARRIRLVSTAAAQGRADFPPAMQTDLDLGGPFADALASGGARQVTVATTLAITTDDRLAEDLAARRGCDVEHLEAFAVAEACSARGIAFGVVLGVANIVGAGARREWLAHHRTAGDAAATRVVRWLEQGAPGLVDDERSSRT
jgi:nucleoside phosphorylase